MLKGIVTVLQIGVLSSALLILLGLCLQPFRPGGFSAERLVTFPQTLNQVWAEISSYFGPQAVITLGLLLLVTTPVLRVGVSLLGFARERNRKFVVITSLVLLILLLSLLLVSQGQRAGYVSDIHHLHFSFLVLALIFAGSICAGLLGALVGLGGGVLIVPLLTLVFGLPIHFAIGASIISVIATSSGAAVAYVRDQVTNVKLGMFLELATTTGAVSGAFLAGLLAPATLSIVFGVILLLSSLPILFKLGEEIPKDVQNDRLASWLDLAGSYPDRRSGRTISYHVTRTPIGLAMMYVAGVISGLLGIGSGEFKVLALDTLMHLPMKVSSTTSNFMIGVTAAASAGIYFSRGDIPPLLAGPVALGILLGALLGARLLMHMSNKALRLVFLPVIALAALEMVLHGLGLGL
ncbi:sulfite exporter TauE/SafE family protein [Ktedonosporobacter rubrisoli]|uniref:Probable membrane transporter protein n=2 Tax=Ktedonosporobacter rubrisoli TaxID=2509675 RepID=A0A4P6K5Y2_KTERU|nr:sulfite exporter TauE/SafE family protein [Ktedonosporobacter rubrisoli]